MARMTLLGQQTERQEDYKEREAWRRRASCKDLDTDLFFPIGETGPAVEQTEAAKAVCRACPVQAPCLEYALVTNEQAGIWGGATEAERRSIRRRRRATQRRAS
jgi:WhiB family redox-sensing transcriptional regulator